MSETKVSVESQPDRMTHEQIISAVDVAVEDFLAAKDRLQEVLHAADVQMVQEVTHYRMIDGMNLAVPDQPTAKSMTETIAHVQEARRHLVN